MTLSINSIIKFFREAKLELDKVIFPTKIQVKQAFIAVVIVVAVVAAYLALVDMLMGAIVNKALN